MAQLRSWSRSEDAEEKRFPFWTPIDEGIKYPRTDESRKIELRRKPKGEVESQSIPEEFEFRLGGDGWRVHEGEPRKAARARLQKVVDDIGGDRDRIGRRDRRPCRGRSSPRQARLAVGVDGGAEDLVVSPAMAVPDLAIEREDEEE